MKFSHLSQNFVGELNELAIAYQDGKKSGQDLIELCSGISGFAAAPRFPVETLTKEWQSGLSSASAYEPDPKGYAPARDALAEYYRGRGVATDAENIILTSGSSLSYLYLFRLLADPGEEILCPLPSYPLFHYIAKMAQVKLAYYPIEERPVAPYWQLNLEHLENCVTTKTKALVFISPHNPTGHMLADEEWQKIVEIAARFELPIIQDEVFSDFIWNEKILPRVATKSAPLTFTLNGLSKNFGLPGIKLGWILMHGAPKIVDEARERLEMMSDTFLPTNEPVQQALPAILAASKTFSPQLNAWVKERRTQAITLLQPGLKHFEILEADAGIYLILRFDEAARPAEDLTVDLLTKTGVLIHPGSFYDIKGNHLVFSFMHAPDLLKTGIERLLGFLEGK